MSEFSTAVLEAKPISEEMITPKEFMRLSDRQKATIKEVRIVPPQLGDKHFGAILVRYKSPIYKVG